MKKYLIHMQEPPYDNTIALEKQEMAFALGAFAQTVAFLFSKAGVMQLVDKSPPKNWKDFTKAYQILDLFGIKNVYMHYLSAKKYNIIKKINIDVVYIDNIEDVLNKYDIVI